MRFSMISPTDGQKEVNFLTVPDYLTKNCKLATRNSIIALTLPSESDKVAYAPMGRIW
jgi:hypothetical protein